MAEIRARHNYAAQNVDELSFKKRDVLILKDKKGNKGWWLAKNVEGKEGLVPSNYFDAPVTTTQDDAFDAKVSWSQTVPQLVSKKESAPAPAAKELQPVDSFGLDEWAKEMEALLLSTPSTRVTAAKVEEKKVVEKIAVEEKKVEKKQQEEERKQPEEKKEGCKSEKVEERKAEPSKPGKKTVILFFIAIDIHSRSE
jgi:hypothetical protein